ncbi:MAG: M48 family metallopeptidase [Fermentimonas sp.]
MKTLQTTKLTFTLLLAWLLTACGSVPFTGRRQLQLVSHGEVVALSLQQYEEFMKTAPVEEGTADARMVTRVGTRIANAVETFYRSKGYESELAYFDWEFNLIADKSVNAFAMPGGKIVIYTGLLPLTQTEEALAVVVGHEVAHVIAQHSSERLSQQIALQYGGAIAGGLLGNSQAMRELGSTVFGLGAEVGVMLPYARKQEYEADEIGLIVMAIAGYDPREAVPFWRRMIQSGGTNVPELLSTHPSDNKRVANIERIMPRMMQYYKGPGVHNNTTEPIQTKTLVPAGIKQAKTSPEWTF